MRRAHAHRRLTAFTALLAVLAAALLPALAHAFAPHAATKWVEVCSASGIVSIEVPADGPGFPKAPKASDFEHCPFCSPHAPAPALLPATIVVLAVPATPQTVLPPAPPAPRPSLAWLAAAPRAPPVLA